MRAQLLLCVLGGGTRGAREVRGLVRVWQTCWVWLCWKAVRVGEDWSLDAMGGAEGRVARLGVVIGWREGGWGDAVGNVWRVLIGSIASIALIEGEII